ncbi:MAG: phosphodiester glycosidase family protein [Clostridia bacterium]|nr:phosphodiester glycosidase family protein [Clostridia bacterium]
MSIIKGKTKEDNKKGRSKITVNVLRILAVIGLTLVLTVILLYFVLLSVFKGPSSTAKELLTRTLKETSAVYMIPDWFLSKAEIEQIMAPGEQQVFNQDMSMISVPTPDPFGYATEAPVSGPTLPPDATPGPAQESGKTGEEHFVEPGIEIYDVISSTYRGKMMIVHDPRRVKVGVLDEYRRDRQGWFLPDFADKYGAVAVINGGGFEDVNGNGDGGLPIGLVIDGGKIKYGDPNEVCSICGFDARGILHVGDMTGTQAIKAGVVSACSYGPALIVNGTPVRLANSGGLNPRTAVGQRADGAILLLTLAGRQIDCIGASYDDLIEIMYSYGAVNATNLDGGSSTMMYYKGERQIKSSSLIGERRLPTSVVVLGAEG